MPIKATVYKTAIQNSYYELEAMRGSRYPQHVNIELSAIVYGYLFLVAPNYGLLMPLIAFISNRCSSSQGERRMQLPPLI